MTSWTLGFGGFTEVMMKMERRWRTWIWVPSMPGWWFRWVPICFMYLYVLICSSMFYCTWYLSIRCWIARYFSGWSEILFETRELGIHGDAEFHPGFRDQPRCQEPPVAEPGAKRTALFFFGWSCTVPIHGMLMDCLPLADFEVGIQNGILRD